MFKADDLRAVVRAYTLGKAHVESIRQVADAFGTYADQVVQLASASHPGAHQMSSKVPDLHKEVGAQLKKESEVTLKAAVEAIKILARYAGQIVT